MEKTQRISKNPFLERKDVFFQMVTLLVPLEMLIWKQLRDILKRKANSSQPLKTIEFS
jgi:hypothetical protein